ncbi:MAG: restriction endonuclease subunit S [Spirochaetales bacterium]
MNRILNNFNFIARSPGGVALLRKLVLELAVRGKLVPQDPNDEPASVLLERIKQEKARLVQQGKIKAGKGMPEIKEEEKPYELPKGWVWARLGEITNYGNTIKPEKIYNSTWVLDLEDIERDTSRIINRSIQGNKQALSDKNVFSINDILYGKLRPYLNKVVVADQHGVCTTEIVPFHCYIEYIPHYFRIVLMSPQFIQYATQKSYGMKMPRLGTEDARKSFFPLPPVSEQSRIVSRVQALMAVLDRLEDQMNRTEEERNHALIAATQAISQAAETEEITSLWLRLANNLDSLVDCAEDVKTIRAMVLELAVRGKLVSQDPRYEPASVLLERIQREKARLVKEGKIKAGKEIPEIKEEEKPYGLPEGWEWVRLPQLITAKDSIKRGPFGSSITKSMFIPYSKKATKVYEQKNAIKKDYQIGNYFINLEEYSSLATFLAGPGDIIISCAGTIGETYLLPPDAPQGVINQALLKIRINQSIIINAYFLLFFKILAQKKVNKDASGSAMKNIGSLEYLRTELLIPLPPLTEQSRIVTRVQELMAILDRLEEKLTARDKAAVLASESIVKMNQA